MQDIYRSLGVRRVINAAGTLTRLGGPPMVPEAVEAMREASRWSVSIEELQERAGSYLAQVTGAEAGYVTCGAAAGLQLAAAACLAGLDIHRMERLPDSSGMPNRIVVQRCQRNAYDHALRAGGAILEEVGQLGNPEVRPTAPWQIEAAIHAGTAAVLWVDMQAEGAVSLEDTVAVAHLHRLPVIVDAAASLPPRDNLQRFVGAGADLVAFSGGKALGGPQASGILVGRRDLIDSVALQHQDMDVWPETWMLRDRFLESGRLLGPPLQGIGRPLKVGKEEIAGLVAAVRAYLKQDPEAWRQDQAGKIQTLRAGLEGLPYLGVTVMDSGEPGYPLLEVELEENPAGLTLVDLVLGLLEGDPAVAVGQQEMPRGRLILNPVSLGADQLELVIERFGSILTG
ncbi:MAG: DegT/DnrJ/EryC1/StrS family aminotransferase [Acidobacteriota bacterium]|nr:DegT/DnrJ/EryC1/StrS family aminotransferase [Acidobacteriota bacterium]